MIANKNTRGRIARLVRDPLFAFLVIGAAVFVADQLVSRDESRLIVVTEAEMDRLAEIWTVQMGRAPTASELNALVDDHVREEILVREAKLLRLDEGDVIVRRRLAQKLSFLTDDVATLAPAEEGALRDYFEAHRDRYETPAVITFSHIYFSPDERQDAFADARQALLTLDPEAWRTTGDPFMLGRTYAHASDSRVRRDFGDAFADALAEMAADPAWRGPVESAYGAHLVRIDAQTPAKGASFESVAERVAADFDAKRRADANRAYFDELRGQYTVELP